MLQSCGGLARNVHLLHRQRLCSYPFIVVEHPAQSFTAPHGTSAIGISCHWSNESVTGVCTGALNSIDVTGWTWADLDHILDFLSSFTPVPGGVENYEEIDSA